MLDPFACSVGEGRVNDSHLDTQSKRSDWTDRLGRLASLAGSAVVLVAALGFPCASLQYYHLRIPLQFLGYDRALRAGILPTFVLMILMATLFGVGYLAARVLPRMRTSGISFEDYPLPIQIILYPFFLILFALGFGLMLVMVAGWFVWMAFPFVWLAQSFGLWAMFIALAVLLVAQFFLFRKQHRIITERRASRTSAQLTQGEPVPRADAEQPQAATDDSDFEQPFSGLYAGLMFGGWFIGALFTLRWASQSWFNWKFLGFLSVTFILTAGAVAGVAFFAAFFTGFSIPAFSSHNRRRRFLAWAELIVTGLLIYVSFSWLYAAQVYEYVPQSLGGGRPDGVIAEITISNPGVDLSMALPSAQCSRNGSWWLCKNLYLVSVRGTNWVVADAQEAYSHALVIPQSELILIQGHLSQTQLPH
jgi:hypothetical protein